MPKSEVIKVRALQASQGNETAVYSFFLKANDLVAVSDISRIRKGDDDVLLGYQRGEVQRHVAEIATYLNSGPVLFPNAVILALSSEVKFKRRTGPAGEGGEDCKAGTLTIPLHPPGRRAAWVVDGQQRTLALSRASVDGLLVPVTGFVSDDFEVHRAQFLLINKVKPLPKGVINELLPEVNTVLPPSLAKKKIPSHICNILNRDPESPFRNLIIRHSTDRKQNREAVVADNSMIDMIDKRLNSYQGCLYQYKNVATGEIDIESVRKALNLYWRVVRDLFPDAWGVPPIKSRLMHGVGIKSMGILMDHIMSSISPEESSLPVIRNALEPIVPHCAWTSGTWDAPDGGIVWNDLQNTPGHVRRLANMLIRSARGLG